jgi:hypothetical protein
MSTYIIKIQWLNTKEWVFFDTENLPAVGDIIETTERWDNPTELVRYQAKILDVVVDRATYVLRLEYSEANNEALRDRGAAWGVSTISVQLGKSPKAKAVWANLVPDEYFDGAGRVSLSEQSLTEELGYAATQSKKRKQNKLRAELESRSLVCEISGESEPTVLQAAHVVEVASSGGYVRSNGLLLRSDIHSLFDGGLLDISEGGVITLSPKVSAQSKYHAEVRNWTIAQSTLLEVADALRKRHTARAIESQEVDE